MTDTQRQQHGLSAWGPEGPASWSTPDTMPVVDRSVDHVECGADGEPPPVSVDDIMRSRGWLTENKGGSVGIAALAIAHPGAALFPLDVQHNLGCVTAAAVVPLSMLADDDDEEDNDEKDDG